MKAYRGIEGISPLILNFTLDGGEVYKVKRLNVQADYI
jgi:hypothetical protein